jgi:hypothetical protein
MVPAETGRDARAAERKDGLAVNRKLLKTGIPLALALALLVTVLLANAVWDESDAVHIKAKDIENSTLAIGTHLIHLSALTDQLYDIAQKSADESGQNLIYYKSELADGTWFDITAASSLKDITKEGSLSPTAPSKPSSSSSTRSPTASPTTCATIPPSTSTTLRTPTTCAGSTRCCLSRTSTTSSRSSRRTRRRERRRLPASSGSSVSM